MRSDATILLSDAVNSTQMGGAQGTGVLGFDMVKLQNPAKTGMWLDEIRFAVSYNQGSALSGTLRGNPTARLGVQLKLGRLPLTNGFVAIGALAANDLMRTPMAGAQYSGSDNSVAFVTWRFAKPLYVPPNEYVQAEVARLLEPVVGVSAGSSQWAWACRIAYVGRAFGSETPAPQTVDVPWASALRSCILDGTTALAITSNNADLCNPHDVPLNMERLGWAQASVSKTDGSPVFNIRLTDRDGNAITRDYVEHTLLFAMGDPNWLTSGANLPPSNQGLGIAPLRGTLPPKSYLRADLEIATGGGGVTDFANVLNLALVGNYTKPVSAIWNG